MTNTMSASLFFKRTFICIFAACFAFTMVYVPQVYVSKVETAYGQAATFDLPAFIQRAIDNISQTATAAFSEVSAYFDGMEWFTTNTLNAIVWQAAKRMLSMIQREIVRWINSGFQGSPAFIQDFGGFMSNVADRVIGGVLTDLGGGFLCSPFRLNVQLAIQTEFYRSQYRNDRSCSLSQIGANLQNFYSNMTEGGWNTWFSIVREPMKYTEYGATLDAKQEAGFRILGAQNQQTLRLNWGAGFLSSEVCEGEGEARKCRITTPGSVISDQLNGVLSYGGESLIAADEINEIIGALMEQFLTMALTGANGLIGMGGGSYYGATQDSYNASLQNTGATPDSFSVNANSNDWGAGSASITNNRTSIVNSLSTERTYLALAKDTVSRYPISFATGQLAQVQQATADRAYNAAVPAVSVATQNITRLEDILARYDAASDETIRTRILNEYVSLSSSLTNPAVLANAQSSWPNAFAGMEVITRNQVQSSLNDELTYGDPSDGHEQTLRSILAAYDAFVTNGDGTTLRNAADQYRTLSDDLHTSSNPYIAPSTGSDGGGQADGGGG
jgi:hypothetical protein